MASLLTDTMDSSLGQAVTGEIKEKRNLFFFLEKCTFFPKSEKICVFSGI